MQFAQYRHLNQGSNTVGFALVAPLLIGAFLAVSQIANVVNVQTVMEAAAKSGAREASRYDANLADGIAEASTILAKHGITDFKKLTASNRTLLGQNIVEVNISKNYQIPWLNFSFELHSTGLSIDEKNF